MSQTSFAGLQPTWWWPLWRSCKLLWEIPLAIPTHWCLSFHSLQPSTFFLPPFFSPSFSSSSQSSFSLSAYPPVTSFSVTLRSPLFGETGCMSASLLGANDSGNRIVFLHVNSKKSVQKLSFVGVPPPKLTTSRQQSSLWNQMKFIYPRLYWRSTFLSLFFAATTVLSE